MAKTLTLGVTRKLFNPILLMPAMLIGNLYFCHFISLSQTLTLPRGRKVNAKQNLLVPPPPPPPPPRHFYSD